MECCDAVYYRAMLFSAKRGIAIACRLSVCPQWLKCNRTRGNAVPPPLISGQRRFPTSKFQVTRGNAKEERNGTL